MKRASASAIRGISPPNIVDARKRYDGLIPYRTPNYAVIKIGKTYVLPIFPNCGRVATSITGLQIAYGLVVILRVLGISPPNIVYARKRYDGLIPYRTPNYAVIKIGKTYVLPIFPNCGRVATSITGLTCGLTVNRLPV